MGESLDIARIGLGPNPAERGLRLVLEKPEVLEYVSRNLLGEVERLHGRSLTERWSSLREEERDDWRRKAVSKLRAFVKAYGTSVKDPE